MLVDTHAHLEFDDYKDDLHEVLKRAKDSGVEKIITLGVDIERAKKAINLAKAHDELFAAIGIHPTDTSNLDLDATVNALDEMLSGGNKVVAVGETGIDFYRTKSENLEKEKEIQVAFFKAHIELAKKYELPVIIHLRGVGAFECAMEVVSEYAPLKGVVHCFSEGVEEARQCIEKGLHISFTGIITFKKSEVMQQVAKEIPLEKIMVETDAPYLAPDPYRGKRNEPAYVLEVAEKIAELRGISFEEVAKQTTKNAHDVFGLNA